MLRLGWRDFQASLMLHTLLSDSTPAQRHPQRPRNLATHVLEGADAILLNLVVGRVLEEVPGGHCS